MDYQATEKLALNAGVTYNNAEDSWDWNDFTERATVVMEGGPEVGLPINESAQPPGQYAPVNYDTWEQNNKIDSYSDLSYEQIQLTVGGTYNFTPSCYTTASLTYDKFISDEDYVYGDEDGEAYYGYLGFGYRF
jgi:long-subunit fatty acid transport protein